MAAAQAINQTPGVFQNLIEGVARRLDVASGHRFGNWLKDSTGLAQLPNFLTRPNFGVVKALQSTRKPPTLGDMLLETVNYAIEEARDRLSALVTGSFIPGGVQELFSYLREHSFDLESRINKISGEVTNFLVDRSSKQAVPAAQVDPSLSHRNVLKLELAGRLREQIGKDTPVNAYGSWGGMAWTRDSIQSKFGYTVEKNQGYFGRVVGIVSEDEAENFRLFEELKKRGIDPIVPKTNDGIGKAVIGMPILARSKSLKAEEVHPSLDHAQLSEKFGGGLIDHYTALAARANSPRTAAAAAERVSREDFSRLFLRAEKDIAPATETGFGFGGEEADLDIVIKMNRGGQMIAWDRKTDAEALSAINCLPYGEYERFGPDGKLVGYTTVGDRGHVNHYDKNHREIPRDLPQAAPDQEFGKTPSFGFA
ncbi:hypothetical protein OIU34_16685 [Pararhizobium sp. BT-229]|uniref:hypothetical protein n=1 Tax=Pararhizobium sp. BT-229 TaxID=2986923 RepID=UPI0021F70D8F|nr:hypothetical protein [Pararhizobium sp. BT-229]MCV9963541.1 hypothetical protein [Pararhizobium sp. BT-229]